MTDVKAHGSRWRWFCDLCETHFPDPYQYAEHRCPKEISE